MTDTTTPFSKKRKLLFLRLLGETGRVTKASAAVGYADTSYVYGLRRRDPEFRKAWDAAMEQAGHLFEDEAVRRGKEGVEKDVYYKGEVVGQEIVYSDGLLGKLLDGAMPEKYAPKKTVEHRGSVEVKGVIGVAVIPMQSNNVEEWERESIALHRDVIDTTATTVVPALAPPTGDTLTTLRKVVVI